MERFDEYGRVGKRHIRICRQRRHRMPDNGFKKANGADIRTDSDTSRRTRPNASDDISGAATEDLVAIFGNEGGSSEANKPSKPDTAHGKDAAAGRGEKRATGNRQVKGDPLESFDDSARHGKPNHDAHRDGSGKRNGQRESADGKRDRGNTDTVRKARRRNAAERTRGTDAGKVTVNSGMKGKVVRNVAVPILAIIAVGGIGYAAWNLTPLHSIFGGGDSVSAANESSIDSEARGRTVNSEKLDFTFEHKGIKYTFTDLTSVAPSETKSANGRETFKVTLKAVNGTDEDYQMTSIGVNVFGPNGDYLADMIRNDTVLENGIDSIDDPVIPSGETYERTLEIPATKSGTYTLEIIDVGTDEIFRVPVDIKVKG